MNHNIALRHLSHADKRMEKLIDKFGPPNFNLMNNYYESLIRSIVYQQLSGKAASIIYERFLDLFVFDIYPEPKDILAVSIETLRSSGLSYQKVNYIQDLSEKWQDGTMNLTDIDSMTDEEISSELIKVKGIGQWTADMFLMFTLGRPDVFPFGDLGIQKGVMILTNMNRLPTQKEMERKTKKWQPYRTVAAWYLWKLVDGPFKW
jgi:3-methyladenine DNA glycosylase/8-oxoguanine DNA glycosylase